MKVNLLNRRHVGPRTPDWARWSRALASLCWLGLPLSMLALGYGLGQASDARSLRGASLDNLQEELAQQAAELADLRDRADLSTRALTMRLARLQARMTRIDALGEHLTAVAGLDEGEFDFSQEPALGGPLFPDAGGAEPIDLRLELEAFQARLEDREQQLEILESMLTHRKLDDQAWVSGRPVEKGWMSSRYGKRTDPFSGQVAMHNGMDFAGVEGSDVLAVAAGVVTWTGTRPGYGEMVEISHGDGLVTRYAHNKQNLVQPGDVVRKGETIALMGNSGRSTGAHVHFEVYKHGRPVDPASYVRRNRR